MIIAINCSPKFTIIVAVPLIDHQWEAVGNDKIGIIVKKHSINDVIMSEIFVYCRNEGDMYCSFRGTYARGVRVNITF